MCRDSFARVPAWRLASSRSGAIFLRPTLAVSPRPWWGHNVQGGDTDGMGKHNGYRLWCVLGHCRSLPPVLPAARSLLLAAHRALEFSDPCSRGAAREERAGWWRCHKAGRPLGERLYLEQGGLQDAGCGTRAHHVRQMTATRGVRVSEALCSHYRARRFRAARSATTLGPRLAWLRRAAAPCTAAQAQGCPRPHVVPRGWPLSAPAPAGLGQAAGLPGGSAQAAGGGGEEGQGGG